MGLIDWIILVFLVFWIVLGIRRGLAGAIVQFVGGILAFFLIGHYYPLVANQLMLKYNHSKSLAGIISVVLIAILIVVLIRFITWILNRFIAAVGLSGINKFMGAVTGFLNGVLIIIVIMATLDYLPKLSDPLKNCEKHRVYAGMDQLKEELFEKLKLHNHIRYIKAPSTKSEAQE